MYINLLKKALGLLVCLTLESQASLEICSIEDNPDLSHANSNIPLYNFLPKDEDNLSDSFSRLGPLNEVFSIVQIREKKKGIWNNLKGTAFIVADSQERACLEHNYYLPSNYSFNSSVQSAKKSPLLCLVSNIHVLDPNSSAKCYAFLFHYIKYSQSSLRDSSDFKLVAVKLPQSRFNEIISHPDENGNIVDLALISLNEIFDFLSKEPRLAGYRPCFTAIDMQSDISTLGFSKIEEDIFMIGFPGQEKDKERQLPLLTNGICSTDPNKLCCEIQTLQRHKKSSIIDFKINMTDIGGASGSPIFIKDSFSGKNLLLGINFAQHSQQIGYVIHVSRLKNFLDETTENLIAKDKWDIISKGVEPIQPIKNTQVESDDNVTAQSPQHLKFSSCSKNVEDKIQEILNQLNRGPAILDLSDNGINDKEIETILAEIKKAGHFSKIIVLNVSYNQIQNLSTFEELLQEENLKFLDLRNNNVSPDNLKNFYGEDEDFSDIKLKIRNKVIMSEKNHDFESIKSKAKINISPKAHRDYYREYSAYL